MVVLRGSDILMLRRAHRPQRGFLDIPGGFMEANESMEEAARRELREETGLELGRVHALGFYWDRYFLKGFGWFPTLNFYYLGRWRSGVPRAADDAASAEWIPLAAVGRAGQRLAWKHMREVFRDVRRWVRTGSRAI
jgi:8-oxo-dGTP diphosphatase